MPPDAGKKPRRRSRHLPDHIAAETVIDIAKLLSGAYPAAYLPVGDECADSFSINFGIASRREEIDFFILFVDVSPFQDAGPGQKRHQPLENPLAMVKLNRAG